MTTIYCANCETKAIKRTRPPDQRLEGRTNMANTNHLQGMACPKCRSNEPFIIKVTGYELVYDSAIGSSYDTKWEDNSACTCERCGYNAIVREFKRPPTS